MVTHKSIWHPLLTLFLTLSGYYYISLDKLFHYKENDMAITARITATKQVPMDKLRKTALVAGVLFLLTFVSIPTLFLDDVEGLFYFQTRRRFRSLK
jgi:hypothetical protein